MAYAIKRGDISLAIIETIKNLLCLVPEVNYSKYNRDNIPEPVVFFTVIGDIIHLPYLFASALLRIIPNINNQYAFTSFEFTGTLRPVQISVELEAQLQLERHGTTTLALPPGSGKTILGAKLSARAHLLTVVLVHREILAGQWKKTYEENTNARVWVVGEKTPPSVCDVIICMNTRWMLIPEATRDLVGFMIIDECHCFCTPSNVQCLLAFHPKFIVAESATLERDDGMHSMIYAICGEHGVYRELNLPFRVMKIVTNVTPERKMNRMQGVDYQNLVATTLFDPRRNAIIIDLVMRNPQNTILILTSLVDHAVLIHDELAKRGESVGLLCGTLKGYHESRVLVGTASKIGTGFDQASATLEPFSGRRFDLLLLVFSIKKNSMRVQNIGRMFRAEYPTVMHFADNDPIYENHWKRARAWYRKRGGTIEEFNIPNLERPGPRTVTEVQQQWIQQKALEFQQRGQVLQLNVVHQ